MRWLLYLVAAVGGLLVTAVVALLVARGGRGDGRIEAAVDISQPRDVVFAWITEPEHLKSWVGWLVEVRPATPDQNGVGTRQIWIMEDRNNNNQRMEIQSEVIVYRRPEQVQTRLNAPEGFTGTVDYRLEAVAPNRTRLTYTASYQYLHWFAKLLGPLISRSAQQKLEADLARLKQHVEAAPGGMTTAR
jgi:uncharacterized protein YndB with AHSA1/START domain